LKPKKPKFEARQRWLAANGQVVVIFSIDQNPDCEEPIGGRVEDRLELTGNWLPDGRHRIAEWTLVRFLGVSEVPKNPPLQEWL
jgi:hypothetical protein